MNASKKWKEMSDVDKQPFHLQHDRLKSQYEIYMEQLMDYKLKMRDIHNSDNDEEPEY